MSHWMRLTAVTAAGVLLWSGAALAQGKSAECDPKKNPAAMTGEVVKIDAQQSKVTVRSSDGVTHEFQASKETLQDLKPGDKIDAKLRNNPKCS
jgi:Cu/Ag efflux protein CusF